MKASTLCAGTAILVLGGFMSVNLAGCGGGGGGGGLSSPTPTNGPQAITFRLQRQDGNASNGGTLTLTGATTLSAAADANGIVTLASVPPGTYTATFTVNDANGNALPPTTTTVIITRTAGQTLLLLQGQSANTGQFSVSGRVRLNPIVNDPDNDPLTANCEVTTVPVTGAFLVSAIDLDTSKGQPIIAQARREAQPSSTDSSLRGRYTIRLPYKPRAFRIQIGRIDESGAVFTGRSAITNFAGSDSVINVDICANNNGTIPGPVVTPSPIPTGTATASPPPGSTNTPVPTRTPEPTNTPQPTNTPLPTNTPQPTNTPGNPTIPTVP